MSEPEGRNWIHAARAKPDRMKSARDQVWKDIKPLRDAGADSVEPGERPVLERMAEREKDEASAAVTLIIDYLTTEYIVEECADHPTMGCMSCEAVELRTKLFALRREIDAL